MKKTFVDQLRVTDTVADLFVLADKTFAQKRDGSHYLNVTLSDRTGSIRGVIWEQAERISERVSSGDVVRIEGSVSEYRGDLQLVIKKLDACPADTVDPAHFLPVTTHSIDGMFDRLAKMTRSMSTDPLRKLLDAFWRDENFVHRFKSAPAAKKMHHAYVGGLLEHTLSMAVLAERIGGHYSGIDMDLLLAGVILHDMGKIQEFEYRFAIDYSDEGRLLSHIVIGLRILDEKLKAVTDFPIETEYLLKHMIVSHHGSRDFGSPEPPKTLEAILLNYIDEIDSKIIGIREFMAAEDPQSAWTSYHKLLGRHFYKGKKT